VPDSTEIPTMRNLSSPSLTVCESPEEVPDVADLKSIELDEVVCLSDIVAVSDRFFVMDFVGKMSEVVAVSDNFFVVNFVSTSEVVAVSDSFSEMDLVGKMSEVVAVSDSFFVVDFVSTSEVVAVSESESLCKKGNVVAAEVSVIVPSEMKNV